MGNIWGAVGGGEWGMLGMKADGGAGTGRLAGLAGVWSERAGM